MDCAISAAITAAQANGAQSSSTLCEQGRRFAELVEMPAGQETQPGAKVQPVADLYVPAPDVAPSGGVTLVNAIDKMRHLSLPGPESSAQPYSDPSEPVDLISDLGEVMRQSVAWQSEIIRISMLGDMVSSMNQGVKTLFQQQG